MMFVNWCASGQPQAKGHQRAVTGRVYSMAVWMTVFATAMTTRPIIGWSVGGWILMARYLWEGHWHKVKRVFEVPRFTDDELRLFNGIVTRMGHPLKKRQEAAAREMQVFVEVYGQARANEMWAHIMNPSYIRKTMQ